MSKICPETGEKVVYLICQECEDKARCSSLTRQESAQIRSANSANKGGKT